MPLNEVEIDQVRSAIQIISRFTGMPQFEGLSELLPRLQQGIKSDQQKPFISFDSNQYLKGIDHLASLYNAINYMKVLKITYQDFKSDAPYQVELHPYYLKQYNNRWFVFGYNPEKKKCDWNLALDRIETFEETTIKYVANKTIDWEEYFEDIIGVTKPGDGSVEKIKLYFFGHTGKYMESKPLHGSQKYRWLSDNLLEVDLEVMINYELERLILSYGDAVRVVCPDKFINLIKTRLCSALNLYN